MQSYRLPLSRQTEPDAYVRIMKRMIAILLLLMLSACAQPQKYYQVPGVVAKSWEPSTKQVQQALSSVEQHCKTRMIDFVKSEGIDPDEIEIEIIFTGETNSFSNTVSNTNSIPKDFKVYGVHYSKFNRRACPFVEKDGDGGIRVIAVQHLLSQDVRKDVKESRPFTVYFNVENGKTGLNTISTHDRDISGSHIFDRVEMIYSPGPPYYIGPERF